MPFRCIQWEVSRGRSASCTHNYDDKIRRLCPPRTFLCRRDRFHPGGIFAGSFPSDSFSGSISAFAGFSGSVAASANTPATAAYSSSVADTDAPQAKQSSPQAPAQEPEHADLQQKRIFGIIPNFKSVSANVHLPPQSVGDKFKTASQDSFDYSSLTLATVVTLDAYAQSSTPEFGTGGVAFGRYFWHTYVDEISENYLVEFIVPVATREDTRYYSLGRGGFLKRAGYSLSRVVVTRSDAGNRTVNLSEIVGAGASAGISNFYYPRPERTLNNTLDKWAVNLGIDALSFFFREFSPDLYHAAFHQKSTPPANTP